MVLGGAISLLVGVLVLAAAALIVLAVWLLLGRREDRPLQNPFTAYLGIVCFVSLLTALGAARVVVSSIGSVLADYPLGMVCDEPEFTVEDEPLPGQPTQELGELIERVQEPDVSITVDGQTQSGRLQPGSPAPPFAPPGPGDCEVIRARDRAARHAAEGGTALIVSLGILMFHARAGKRLLDEETRDA